MKFIASYQKEKKGGGGETEKQNKIKTNERKQLFFKSPLNNQILPKYSTL